MFGFSKSFVIFLFLSLIIWRYAGWQNGVGLMVLYIIVKVVWKLFT